MNITQTLGTDIAHVNGDLIRSQSGDLGTISGLNNLKVALYHRLMTVPGTLIHRPTYGCGVSAYQNAPTSFTVQQELAQIIQEQFILDPRVKSVDSISINYNDAQPELTTIQIFVTPIGYTDSQQMVYTPFAGGI